MNNKTHWVIIIFISCIFFSCKNQNHVAEPGSYPAGKLFIIGGGDRADSMMAVAFRESGVMDSNYVVVLPMATSEPDSAFTYFNEQYKKLTGRNAVMLFCDTGTVVPGSSIDSLKNAGLIFLSGGDQAVFMKRIEGTELASAIKYAYDNGCMIGGTSAGASLMSCRMITGEQLKDSVYEATFDKLIRDNLETMQGLCLLDSVIIDQHFVARSRYNRMFSGLADFTQYQYIGIDEETAILVVKDSALVVGQGQVIVGEKMDDVSFSPAGKITFSDVELAVYTSGQRFKIKR